MITVLRSNHRPNQPRRRFHGGAALLAGLTAAAASGSGVAGVAGVVGAASRGDTIELPLPFEVDQEASFVGTFTTTVDADIQGQSESFTLVMELGYDSTVSELLDDGGAVVQSTFTSAEVVEGGDDIDTGAIEDLVGVSYEEDYAADGSVTERRVLDDGSLTDDQRAAAEDFLTQAEATAVVFPDHPVAVGDTWTEETSIESQGVSIPATYTYELVGLTDDTYTISLGYEADIDTEIGGLDVTGDVSGKGTIVGDRANRLAMSVTVDQTMGMGLDGDTMRFAITVDLQAQ